MDKLKVLIEAVFLFRWWVLVASVLACVFTWYVPSPRELYVCPLCRSHMPDALPAIDLVPSVDHINGD